MGYLQVKDLKKSRELWERLERDHELVLTKDGQPRAILVGIHPDELEEALTEIRRALFSSAVSRIRARAEKLPPADEAIGRAVRSSRKRRR
jgi:hypothetical protein